MRVRTASRMTRAFHVVHTPRVRHACSEGPAPVRDRPSARRAPERLQSGCPVSPDSAKATCVCVFSLCVPRVLSAQAGESHPLSSVRAPHRTRDLLAQRTTCRAALLPPASLQTGVGAPANPARRPCGVLAGSCRGWPGPDPCGCLALCLLLSARVYFHHVSVSEERGEAQEATCL